MCVQCVAYAIMNRTNPARFVGVDFAKDQPENASSGHAKEAFNQQATADRPESMDETIRRLERQNEQQRRHLAAANDHIDTLQRELETARRGKSIALQYAKLVTDQIKL